MGASVAKSSNVAKAVSNISNSVSQNTYTNADQVEKSVQTLLLQNCQIDARDFDVKYTATSKIQSKQIASASQDSQISNDIAQSAIQEATSDAGITIGIGYSSASNASSQMANVANTVSNEMQTISSEVSDTLQSFTCNGSTIHLSGDLKINFNSDTSMIAEQIVSNSQVTDLQNKISQITKQTASATSGGLAALIIAIAILVCAFGYFLAKPLSSPGGMIIVFVLVFVISGSCLIGLYAKEAAPLFNKPIDCIKSSDCPDCACIDMKDTEIQYDTTPLRYKYSICNENPNLLQIVIAKYSNKSSDPLCKNNGGYNNIVRINIQDDMDKQYDMLVRDTQTTIARPPPILLPTTYLIPIQFRRNIMNETNDEIKQLGICTPGICSISDGSYSSVVKTSDYFNGRYIPPKPITGSGDGNTIATINRTAFSTYCKNDLQAQVARLLLCRLLNIDCSMYIVPSEFVVIDNKYEPSSAGICFKPNGSFNFNDGISDHGVIVGKLGTCNTRSHKIKKYNKYFGITLIVVVSICIIALIFRRRGKVVPAIV